MYSITDIAAALTIYRETRDKFEFEYVRDLLSERERSYFTDILSDLNLIREIRKETGWYAEDVEYIWVWIQEDNYTDC
jgi:hypothetical protein